jgi:hypothetical protein
MSGNTNGPHLHFTTYKGDKTLKNKVDPFGWDSSITDPWEIFGSKSSYLWNLKNNIQNIQANPTKNYTTAIGKLSIELLNLNSIFIPINIEVEAVPPIYDLKNFKYKSNTSYQLTSFDLESKTIPQSILGILSFSGFKTGDDKYYSIWKVTDNSVEKQVTTFNSFNQTLSTIFEPKAQYLVLRDNYKKISVKSNLKAN